jgi:hypothetical protein
MSDNWISVKDRLPEREAQVLVVLQFDGWRTIQLATRSYLIQWLANYKEGIVLYWMPLPELPKE